MALSVACTVKQHRNGYWTFQIYSSRMSWTLPLAMEAAASNSTALQQSDGDPSSTEFKICRFFLTQKLG